jgi:Ni,Fe-hydrogenase maturation factor
VAAASIVGIGQLAAGDDRVGLAIARELAARGLAGCDWLTSQTLGTNLPPAPLTWIPALRSMR